MVTARQKVLTYFTKTRTASAREISRSLKMSAATVRHHLRVLTADGRLEMSFVRGREGRGRPEKVYSLPRSALGDNLAALGDAVLAEAGSSIQMETLAKRLAGEADFSEPAGRQAVECQCRKIEPDELSRPLGSRSAGTASDLRPLSLCRFDRRNIPSCARWMRHCSGN